MPAGASRLCRRDPGRVYPRTVKSLVGRRMGYFDALKIVHLAARDRDKTVSIAVGPRADSRLAILEGALEQRRQEWQVWEG